VAPARRRSSASAWSPRSTWWPRSSRSGAPEAPSCRLIPPIPLTGWPSCWRIRERRCC